MTRLADIAPCPLLFLDVDGVLNCVEREEWGQPVDLDDGHRFAVFPPPGTTPMQKPLPS